jgi:hypothetical protein
VTWWWRKFSQTAGRVANRLRSATRYHRTANAAELLRIASIIAMAKQPISDQHLKRSGAIVLLTVVTPFSTSNTLDPVVARYRINLGD